MNIINYNELLFIHTFETFNIILKINLYEISLISKSKFIYLRNKHL